MISLTINLYSFEKQVFLLQLGLIMDYLKLEMECFYCMEEKIRRVEDHSVIFGMLGFTLKNKMLIFLNKSIKEIMNITSSLGDKDSHFISFKIFKTQ